MRIRLVGLLGILLFFAACTDAVTRNNDARILAMGDSLMAWHGTSHNSVADRLSDILSEPVIDRSVVGARVVYDLPISGALGMNIPKQYRPGKWDWVVLNGGGNDLWLGCGCFRCDRRMERMISEDGSKGELAKLIARIRATGAQVIYVGYLRSPGVGSPIEHCRDEGDELERRVERLVEKTDGVHFISLANLVPYGDRSFHAFDMIHPSLKASAIISDRIARIIRTETD